MATQAGESNTILASDSSVACHGELAHRTCQFMMVFGLTLAMIMGHLDLNQKKMGGIFDIGKLHHMKCSREFNKIYIYIYTHALKNSTMYRYIAYIYMRICIYICIHE